MKKYVINLKRRTDRLNLFYRQINEYYSLLEFNVVYGFDGRNPESETDNVEEFNRITSTMSKTHKYPHLIPGEAAIIISHRRVWKLIVEGNGDYGMVFEDDALFTNDFRTKIDQIVETINRSKKEINFVWIGGRFYDGYRMNKQNYEVLKQLPDITLVKHHAGADYINNIDLHRTAHAYIVSKETAKFLLDVTNSLITSGNVEIKPVDRIMPELMNANGIDQCSTYPLLCWSPAISDSDVR